MYITVKPWPKDNALCLIFSAEVPNCVSYMFKKNIIINDRLNNFIF